MKALARDRYHEIIRSYFAAFATGNFSAVGFSSQIRFLSPMSGKEFIGREDVTRFVSNVATRVTKVNVIAVHVDVPPENVELPTADLELPTAGGVWEMTTTKGRKYILHNFFRLDGEGLRYIWPMFDPKAVMDDPPGLLSWLNGRGWYEVAATTPTQVAGVTASKGGRLFVNFPRWIDPPNPSVAEIDRASGALIPFPNAQVNAWDPASIEAAPDQFVCVQSVVADADDNLWILDPASPMFTGVVPGGAKLLRVNLATNLVERTYIFSDAIAPTRSYLNDVRFAKGSAFITDSGLGALVVLDLATGRGRRLLQSHPSTKAEAGFEPNIEKAAWKFSNDGTTPQVHSDGIAIDPSARYVYYKALTARTLYRIPVDALLNEKLSPEELAGQVEAVRQVGATDGLEFDGDGNLYLTSLEQDALFVLRNDGRFEKFATSPDFSWPDSISIQGKDLYFTTTQFHRMPLFHGNEDRRQPPYRIFRCSLK